MIHVDKALEYIKPGFVVGLGSGHAAEQFIEALGEKVRAGLNIRAVPTSNNSAELARQQGIPLITLREAIPIDVTVDGADEVDPHLNLIKGFGRALVREKIVAAASKQWIILIGPEHVAEKIVPVLGGRGRLPVEVVPFALPFCQWRLRQLGLAAEPLLDNGEIFVTDNGNHILECRVTAIPDPASLEQELRAIPGVVGSGLFLNMAPLVLIQIDGKLEIRQRN